MLETLYFMELALCKGNAYLFSLAASNTLGSHPAAAQKYCTVDWQVHQDPEISRESLRLRREAIIKSIKSFSPSHASSCDLCPSATRGPRG